MRRPHPIVRSPNWFLGRGAGRLRPARTEATRGRSKVGATTDDPYDLERFIVAQNADGMYERALRELQRGHKTSHWMWFVFPQMAGLGQSTMSRTFAISSLDEARTYLQHDVLGPRLIECASVVAHRAGQAAEQIFGRIDAQKLRSSMTLFLRASPGEPIFQQVLDRYFDGLPDAATDQLV